MSWHPFILLFTVSLPHSFGGGNAVFHMAAFSYIADSSVPRNRTWRLGVAEAFWFLGSPVGLFLGAYLFERGGYLCVFATAVAFHLVAVLYSGLILPEVPQPRPSRHVIGKHGSYGTNYDPIIVRARCFSENEKEIRHPGIRENEKKITKHIMAKENNNERQSLLYGSNGTSGVSSVSTLRRTRTVLSTVEEEETIHVWDFVIGTVKTVVRHRPNHTRKCLLALGLILFLYGIANHGTFLRFR